MLPRIASEFLGVLPFASIFQLLSNSIVVQWIWELRRSKFPSKENNLCYTGLNLKKVLGFGMHKWKSQDLFNLLLKKTLNTACSISHYTQTHKTRKINKFLNGLCNCSMRDELICYKNRKMILISRLHRNFMSLDNTEFNVFPVMWFMLDNGEWQ